MPPALQATVPLLVSTQFHRSWSLPLVINRSELVAIVIGPPLFHTPTTQFKPPLITLLPAAKVPPLIWTLVEVRVPLIRNPPPLSTSVPVFVAVPPVKLPPLCSSTRPPCTSHEPPV